MSFAPLVQAQTEARTARAENPIRYDVTKEVTLTGTVSKVLAKASPGMLWGSHLLLATASGEVDASLGLSGSHGRGALCVKPGEQVEVTGVMKTLNNKRVFLARTVKAGERVYAIRNERGIPLPPQSRERVSPESAEKGETL